MHNQLTSTEPLSNDRPEACFGCQYVNTEAKRSVLGGMTVGWGGGFGREVCAKSSMCKKTLYNNNGFNFVREQLKEHLIKTTCTHSSSAI